MIDVFISYSSSDAALARKIASGLRENGLSVWIDNANDPGGDQLFEEIKKAINDSKVFIPIVSNDSVSTKWLREELVISAGSGKQILPIGFGVTDFPVDIKHLDFISGDQNDLEKTIFRIVKEVESHNLAYLRKRGLSRIWYIDAFSVVAGILGIIAAIASAKLAFK